MARDGSGGSGGPPSGGGAGGGTGGAGGRSAVRPHRTTSFTTATILLYFQKRPGTDTISIVTGVTGQLRVGRNPAVDVRDNSGLYTLLVPRGSSAELHIFDTTYVVRHGDDMEVEVRGPGNAGVVAEIPLLPDPGHSDLLALDGSSIPKIPITHWYALGECANVVANAEWDGLQRRLQMLGYFWGRVTGEPGKYTEFAVLNFQADHRRDQRRRSVRIDGESGPRTCGLINHIFRTENTVQTTQYCVRRTFVHFKRFVNPRAAATLARQFVDGSIYFPPVDDRGFVTDASPSGAGGPFHGPLVHTLRGDRFKITLVRHDVSNAALLSVSSSDTNILTVQGARSNVLTLSHGTENHIILRGEGAGTAILQVRCGSQSSDPIIAELHVTVRDLPLVNLNIRPYWVTINGTAPGRNRAQVQANIWDVVTAMYRPFGISFTVRSMYNKSITLGRRAGRAPQPGVVRHNSGYADADDLHRASFTVAAPDGTSRNLTAESDAINFYFVHDIERAMGVAAPPVIFRHNWVILGDDGHGLTAGHELGHYLYLANAERRSAIRWHSEDDPSERSKKKDYWSLRQLMSGSWPDAVRGTHPWVQDPGDYGMRGSAGMINTRDLPHTRTDGEAARIMRRAQHARRYR